MNDQTIGAVRDPRDLVREYEEKLAGIPDIIKSFTEAVKEAEAGSTVAGTYGREQIFCCSRPSLSERTMKANLLKSAWWAAYSWCNMKILATAEDKKRIEQDFQNPVPFTVENLTATFGPYLADQRTHILRGLAEAFVNLDDAYKSHSKVKVGVKGLPKRVIINNAKSEWGSAWGWQRAEDMINALKVFNGEGLTPADIMSDIRYQKKLTYSGLEFRWFQNGNLHIHFDQDACRQINLGLAEYYGDVLPDVEPDKSNMKPDLGKTDVSKDLQYYPTPIAVADKILSNVHFRDGDNVLEPSCGCGRLMDAIKKAVLDDNRRGFRQAQPAVTLQGIEYDRSRAGMAKAKGYVVTEANFLEVRPKPTFTKIIMNPPFYGKHYLKHIEHAFRFAHPDGCEIISILPATAHYDHKKLPPDYKWQDLPVGSFAESGVRVPTGYATWRI